MTSSLIFRQLFDYETWTYTYLIADPVSREACIIDSVKERAKRDLTLIRDLGLKLKYILETHVHADHITGASDLKDETGALIALSEFSGLTQADRLLRDQDLLPLGNFNIKVISTPGHTNACTSFYINGMVFTGDTLFVRDVGRTDFQEGSNEKMYKSITEKLFSLSDDTKVFPAHDYNGHMMSTIGEEKKFNIKVGAQRSLAEFTHLMQAMKLAQPKRIHIAVPANMKLGRVEAPS